VGDEADRLPESEILAQMKFVLFALDASSSDNDAISFTSSFIIAANETTSHALARIFHLLALNPEAQIRLRQEVTEARGEDDLTYNELLALPYLDAVVRECMRLLVNVRTNESSVTFA
jgi:cytochrome P450